MSAVPVTETETVPEAATAARRRIGDILLELGFATEEQVAGAVAEQEQTGQPLGQILVQQGVITRLELASALAEQWSDQSVSISLLPIPKPAARPAPQHHDDDQYAARLQDAVVDLAQRVHATQASNAVDDRVTDLAERIEATVARTQRIEVTLATLAESLEGVTGGVEEAFSGLQAGMAALALDLARIESAVAAIVALPDEPPSSDPALSERLEELEAAVRALAERPADHDAIAERIEELASRFETLGESAALDDLREALGQIQVRVEALAGEGPAAELERQSAFLADLRTTVADLEARPVGSPEIDARLERIEAGLAKRPDTAPDSAAVEELAARVEATSAAQDAVVASVNALGPRIDEIVARIEHDDGTESRIDDLEARLAAGAAAVVELAGDRGDHALLAGRLEALESRLASNLATSDELSRALDGARNELGATTPEADGRVDQLARDLDALRTDLARARDELGRTAAPEPDSRVDQLAHEIDAVRADLARVAIPAPPDPELTSRLELLAGRVEELAADQGAHAELAGELQAVQRQLASDLVTSADFERAIGEIRTELARPPATPSASPEAEQRVARLEERLGSLDALSARVDGLAKELESASPAEPVPGADDLRRQIDDRVEELGRTLEERLAATEPASPAAVEGPEGIEKELERMLLAIERVGHHLGEHDRALAEVMRSHGVAQRLDELAARVDELAAGEAAAVPASSSRPASAVGSADMHALVRRVEDAEKSSAADREKLMNRLERMASSIDWRLQRLEAGEPTS